MRCEQGHNLPALVPCREAGKLPSEGPSLPGDGIYWEGPVLGHQCSRPHRAHQVQEPVSLRAPWPLTCFQTRWHSREHPPHPGLPVRAPSETRSPPAEHRAGCRDEPEPAQLPASWAQPLSLDLCSNNPCWPLLWPGANGDHHGYDG